MAKPNKEIPIGLPANGDHRLLEFWAESGATSTMNGLLALELVSGIVFRNLDARLT